MKHKLSPVSRSLYAVASTIFFFTCGPPTLLLFTRAPLLVASCMTHGPRFGYCDRSASHAAGVGSGGRCFIPAGFLSRVFRVPMKVSRLYLWWGGQETSGVGAVPLIFMIAHLLHQTPGHPQGIHPERRGDWFLWPPPLMVGSACWTLAAALQ